MPRSRTVGTLWLAIAATLATAPGQTPPKSDPPFALTEVDRKLHAEVEALDRLFEKRRLVLHDSALDDHIRELAGPLLPPGELELVQWRFRVLREPIVNAFALPNGSIYLHSGLLARAENDDQVAAVLAHEIAHVARRHGYTFNRSLRKKSAALHAIAAVRAWMPFGGALGSALAAASQVSQFAVVISIYGHSQEMEQDADQAGLAAMRRTQRDPAQFIRIFELLQERIEPQPEPLFLRTHPRTEKRIETAAARIGLDPKVPPSPNRAYVERMRPLIVHNLQLDLAARRYRSAVLGASRLVEASPRDAESLYWLGEAYRALGPRKARLSPDEMGYWSQRKAYSDEHNRTEEDQAKRLSARPEGLAALHENQAKAKECFEKAAALDPTSAPAQLGFGMLLQDQGKTSEALAAYARYLQLAPGAADRLRVERRMEALRRAGGSR